MKKVKQYIKQWETQGYSNGIPDEVPNVLMQENLAPSYKAICIAIMKNDVQCEFLGFSRAKCNAYMALKKIEIENRENNKVQLSFKNIF